MEELIFGEQKFIDWCISSEKLSEGSANSYKTYMNRFFNLYQQDIINKVQFELLIKNGDTEAIAEVFVNMFTLINNECNAEKPQMKISSFQKTKSALIKYQNYLLEQAVENYDDEKEKIVKTADTKEDNSQSVHTAPATEFIKPLQSVKEVNLSKDEIKNNYNFRLTTQDRPYGNIYFPISVLKKLFYKNEEHEFFNKWIQERIDSIQLHIEGEQTISLDKVKAMLINKDGSTTITCNDGIKHELYSKMAKSDTLSKQYTPSFSKVVLDHVNPMRQILNDNIDNLPVLRRITELMIKANHNSRLTNRIEIAYIGKQLLENNSITKDDIPAIKKELELIGEKTELQLMDARQNRLKSARLR